jgi:hypothetical protein
MLENQTKWYTPAPLDLGWHVGCGCLLYWRMSTHPRSLELHRWNRLHALWCVWVFERSLGPIPKRTLHILGRLGFLNRECLAAVRSSQSSGVASELKSIVTLFELLTRNGDAIPIQFVYSTGHWTPTDSNP